MSSINNKSALVQIIALMMACRRAGDKPLPESMVYCLLNMYMCVCIYHTYATPGFDRLTLLLYKYILLQI